MLQDNLLLILSLLFVSSMLAILSHKLHISYPIVMVIAGLVISQTQEVHEQIVDLLEQLRRLQDLQVTIEVRFITLNDNFFEQIGVDFQAAIPNQSVTAAQVANATAEFLKDGDAATYAVDAERLGNLNKRFE